MSRRLYKNHEIQELLDGSGSADAEATLKALIDANGGVLVKNPDNSFSVYAPNADTNAARGAAITAAKNAASPGSLIHVHGSSIVDEPINKNLVAYYFHPGSTLTGASGVSPISDSGSSITSIIGGRADIIGVNAPPVSITGAGSNIYLEYRNSTAPTDSVHSGFKVTGGTVRAVVYGNITGPSVDTPNNGSTIECTGGDLDLTCFGDLLSRSGVNKSGSGTCSIIARNIISSGTIAVIDHLDTTGNSKLRVTAQRIGGTSTSNVSMETGSVFIAGGSGLTMIDCPEITGAIIADGNVNARIIKSHIAPLATNFPAIRVYGNGLTLENCTLVPNGTGLAMDDEGTGDCIVNVVGGLRYSGQVFPGIAVSGDFVHRLLSTTNDTTFVIPAGSMIAGITFHNSIANAVTGGVKIGTTAGGADVVSAQAIGANEIGTIADSAILKRFFSASVNQTLYIQDVSNWNNASVNFAFDLRKVF